MVRFLVSGLLFWRFVSSMAKEGSQGTLLDEHRGAFASPQIPIEDVTVGGCSALESPLLNEPLLPLSQSLLDRVLLRDHISLENLLRFLRLLRLL